MPGIIPTVEFSLDNVSVWSLNHFNFLASSSVFISLFIRFSQFSQFQGLVQSYLLPLDSVMSQIISALPLCPQKVISRISWVISFHGTAPKDSFCQAMVVLGLSTMCCFLFISTKTVPTLLHLLRKHSFQYYISQNFHLLFATQGWCPGVHILQSYWPLI